MDNFTQIIQEINENVNTNGTKEITGAKLNDVLRDMITAVSDNLPTMYTEDKDDETATLQASLLKIILETATIQAEGARFYVNGSSFEFSSNSGEVFFHVGNDGLHIALQDLFVLDFSPSAFRVELNDGDPVVLQYDVNNGLRVMGGLRVNEITLDGVDLSETLGDLQRQIDELKNQ